MNRIIIVNTFNRLEDFNLSLKTGQNEVKLPENSRLNMTGKSIPAYKENGMPHPHTFHRLSNKKAGIVSCKNVHYCRVSKNRARACVQRNNCGKVWKKEKTQTSQA